MNFTEEQMQEMYIDWFNNFLTVPHFAEHYGITKEQAQTIIDKGRNNEKHK